MGFCRPESLTDGSIVGTPIHMPAEIFDGKFVTFTKGHFRVCMWYFLGNKGRVQNVRGLYF